MRRVRALVLLIGVLAGCSSSVPSGGDAAPDVTPDASLATDAQNVAHDARPPFDAAPFACAEAGVCDPATEYCVIEWGDPPRVGQTEPDIAMCVPLPAACVGAPSCECVTEHALDWCSTRMSPMLDCSDESGAIYCTQSP